MLVVAVVVCAATTGCDSSDDGRQHVAVVSRFCCRYRTFSTILLYVNVFRADPHRLTLLEPQSRFGEKILRI